MNFETKVTKNYSLRIPLIAANMDTICESGMAIEIGRLGGLGVIHRFMSIESQAEEVKKVSEKRILCAAAVGVKDYKERSEELVKSGVNIIVIDIAHGHSKYAGKALDYLKQKYPKTDIIAGNVATKDAAEYFISKGADAIKVGIGPGKVCTTKEMTGVGTPQLTAIMEVHEATYGKIPLIADGGIKKPGDIVKALGAGADCVMCGYIFSGCNECPRQDFYRGSASEGVKGEAAFIEGREIKIERRGSVEKVINKFLEGLASGMTYCGKNKLKDFIGKAEFVLVR